MGRELSGDEHIVGVYEMFWDCAFCDTKALLGKTHRNCPNCGAPQDPARRYFPPPGQEVAANTKYDGADRICPACTTPNGALANNCRACGSPLDQAATAKLIADRPDGAVAAVPPAPAPAPARRHGWVKWVVLGLLAAIGAFALVAVFWTKEVGAQVRSLTWSRQIDVESLQRVEESSWCDSMPSDAYSVSRSRQQRSTRSVADGKDCKTENVDRGDGTFERRKVCTTRYRQEPVYADRCRYTVHRWRPNRTERAGGTPADPRRWPPVTLGRTGTCLGCERTSRHREQYQVMLLDGQGNHHQCEQPEARWGQYVVGRRYQLQVRALTGGADCGSLKP